MRLIILTLLLGAPLAQASTYKIFHEVAVKVGVPTPLLRAICWAESRLDSLAYNHGDGGTDNSSFGTCQVLYSTAVLLGFSDKGCSNDFSDIEDRTAANCKLFSNRTNITLAAKNLKRQLIRYNGSWVSAIAAYNTGSVISCKKGWLTRKKDKKRIARCVIGGYINQTYVDRVIQALREGK